RRAAPRGAGGRGRRACAAGVWGARAGRVVRGRAQGGPRRRGPPGALAPRPRRLLLDEPMAGLGAEESARMVELLRELKREVTILLIEHDMAAVFALADRITVLVYGRVIASGAPAAVRGNAGGRQAYLGEHSDGS